MKKFLVALAVAVVCGISSWAYTLNSSSVFTGEGESYGINLQMNSNGSCVLISPETGRMDGSYDITNGSVEPGCSGINVVFNFDGMRVYGTLLWPSQGDLMIVFDGMTLYKR